MSKRIVMWCGNAANQKALVQKIHQRFGLSAIVIDTKEQSSKRSKPSSIWKKLYEVCRFWSLHYSWRKLLKKYNSEFSSWPDVPIFKAKVINSEEVYNFTLEQKPDLIVVSGTSLIKKPLLEIPVSIGIMNLHTGLSPYVKGGPNCTNWCIAENNWHLIGNTIMWINAGIDTGNLITTETIDVRICKSLTEAHIKVMEHAHDLYLRAIGYVLSTKPPYNAIPQKHLGQGSLYLTKMWTTEIKKKMIYNWRKRKQTKTKNSYPKTVALPET